MASAAVVIVAATSAFEVASPRLAVGVLQVSTLEATTGLALVTGLASLAVGPGPRHRLAFAIPALTGLALAAASAAAAAIEPLVRATHGDGIDYPQRDCWVCAQVWRATGRHAAADDMLALGRAIIAARAARISDPALRAQFLRAAPYHGLYR